MAAKQETEFIPAPIKQIDQEEESWQAIIFRHAPTTTSLIGKAVLGKSNETVYFRRSVDRVLDVGDLQEWEEVFKGLPTQRLTRNNALRLRRNDIAWSRRPSIAANIAELWRNDFFFGEVDENEPLMGGLYAPTAEHPDRYYRVRVPLDGAVQVTIEDPPYKHQKFGELTEHTYAMPRSVPFVTHAGEAVDGARYDITIFGDTSVAPAISSTTGNILKEMLKDDSTIG